MLTALPDSVIYAGLGGCLLALIVATAQQKWQLKAFFMLALRLAIGWQFLFEGLYKINTDSVGPSETNKVFTSEPYFKASPTGLGEWMRKKFSDPSAVIVETIAPSLSEKYTPSQFMALPSSEQIAACPPAVAKQLDDLRASAEQVVREEAAADLAFAKKKPNSDVAKAQAAYDAQIGNVSMVATDRVEVAKLAYARWAHGTAARDAKVRHVSSDVGLSAPQRLQLIEHHEAALKQAESRQAAGIGNGNGVELKRVAELRTELLSMQADLAKDALAFAAELKKDLGFKEPVEKLPLSEGQQLDKVTMWFIAIVGACILFGFLTRISCILAAGFLLVTYLTHPPFPWYSLPPATEGNPLFVNKNLIEMFALLVLSCYPTGRWLGLDAILALILPWGRNRNSDLTPGG